MAKPVDYFLLNQNMQCCITLAHHIIKTRAPKPPSFTKKTSPVCLHLSVSTEALIHAFITSSLEAFMTACAPNSPINSSMYRNSTAHLLTHITPVHITLPRLPVKQRIHFKILFFTCNALCHQPHPYFTDLPHQPRNCVTVLVKWLVH